MIVGLREYRARALTAFTQLPAELKGLTFDADAVGLYADGACNQKFEWVRSRACSQLWARKIILGKNEGMGYAAGIRILHFVK